MEKRLIFAVALSLLIVIAFQHFAPKPPKPLPGQSAVSTSAPAETKKAADETAPYVSAYSPSEALGEEQEMAVETDRYVLTFSNIGGAVKSISLKDYKDNTASGLYELIKLKDPRDYVLSVTGRAGTEPIKLAAYEMSKDGNNIRYVASSNGIRIAKNYMLHNSNNGIELRISIKNESNSPKTISYTINGGAGLTEPSQVDRRFIEASANIDGKVSGLKMPKDGRNTRPGVVGWMALRNKYFSIILKPLTGSTGGFVTAGSGNLPRVGVSSKEIELAPGEAIEEKFILYAGPAQISALKKFGYGLDEAISYGFFGGISKALITLMALINKVTNNWGLTIILLALVLNIVLFPLSLKSFKSMKKMQELHPEMEKIKAQNKNNPQKLNKEIMELYKKYNINPLSGCLPLFLQIPVFFALYQALSKAIELRSSSFLWIKDLSMPDAVKIPVTLPIVGNSINVLPILMVIAMVFQQKMSSGSMGAAVTEEQKQQQKMMLILMPVIFGFMFYNVPSGLVLYWFVNTVLTVAEQAIVFKNLQ